MKLLCSPTSPFVRLVMATAHELGLAGRIELVKVDHLGAAPDTILAEANPVLKVPTLVLDDGSTLYDSRVIVEYLASVASDTRLFPPQAPARWTTAKRLALGLGVMDATALILYEKILRPESAYCQSWVDRQFIKIFSSLDMLEVEAAASSFTIADLTIAELAIGCALGFLDFRLPERNWRRNRPKLAAWFEALEQRPSIAATRPPLF